MILISKALICTKTNDNYAILKHKNLTATVSKGILQISGQAIITTLSHNKDNLALDLEQKIILNNSQIGKDYKHRTNA